MSQPLSPSTHLSRLSPVEATTSSTLPASSSSTGLARLTVSSLQSPEQENSCCQDLWMRAGNIYDHLRMCITIAYHWVIKNVFCVHLPNFTQVDTRVYRGAQPTSQGFQTLRDTYGVRMIINLRTLSPQDLEAARQEVTSAGLAFHHIPISTTQPSEAHISELCNILSSEQGPIFIHCFFGADRTGFSVALYRLSQGWTKERAIQEMVDGGFGYHSFLSAGLRQTLDRIDFTPTASRSDRGTGG